MLFRINAQSEAFEEALAARGIPYVVRGAARFFDRPEVREAVTRLRGAARSGEAADDARSIAERGRRDPRRHGLDRRGADRPRPDPRPLGVLAGAGRPGRRVRRPRRAPTSTRFVDDLDRRAAEQHAPVADGVTLGDLPRRQGPRVGLGLPLRPPGRHPADHLRRHPGRDRGGAPAALRRHDPRPARPRAVLGAGPQPGRPRLAQAVPVPRPAAARRRPRPAGEQPRSRKVAELPRVRPAAGRPARRRSAAAARTARRRTTRSCSSGCASGARSAPARRACRRSWSSPTRPCS